MEFGQIVWAREYPDFLAFIILVLFCAFLLCFCPWKERKERKKKEVMSRKMVARAKQIGPVCFINETENVYGLCLAADYSRELQRYQENFARRPNDLKAMLRKVSVRVPATFSFWKTETAQRLVHTGSYADLEQLVWLVVKLATDIDIDTAQVDREACKEAAAILMPDKPQLFVPYASGNQDTLEDQFCFYGRLTLDLARDRIFARLPEWKESQEKTGQKESYVASGLAGEITPPRKL